MIVDEEELQWKQAHPDGSSRLSSAWAAAMSQVSLFPCISCVMLILQLYLFRPTLDIPTSLHDTRFERRGEHFVFSCAVTLLGGIPCVLYRCV